MASVYEKILVGFHLLAGGQGAIRWMAGGLSPRIVAPMIVGSDNAAVFQNFEGESLTMWIPVVPFMFGFVNPLMIL